MIKRQATTNWTGSGKEGKGEISVESKVFSNAPMAYGSRFKEDDGTNPEELIGAAHSGCFTMALTFKLEEAGYTPNELTTTCTVSFEDGSVTQSHLNVKADVKDIESAAFERILNDAAANCPISKLLNTEITTEYKLN